MESDWIADMGLEKLMSYRPITKVPYYGAYPVGIVMSNLVHFFGPSMCFDASSAFDLQTSIACSKFIEDVTCPKCVYYYYHPEAKELERAYRNKRS